jgi:hypothetical protein
LPVTDDADDDAFHDGGIKSLGMAAAGDVQLQRLQVHVPVRGPRFLRANAV